MSADTARDLLRSPAGLRVTVAELRAENADHLLRADLLRARIRELENECDHAGRILGRIGALLDDYEHINVPDPADLDDDDGSYIWVSRGRQGGTPCIGGTRVPVETLTAYADALTDDAALEAYPGCTSADLAEARWYLNHHEETP